MIVLASIVGCEQVRKVTYPPGFTYLDDKEVDALMHRMGESIGKIDQLADKEPPSGSDEQQEIITELDKLEDIATRLSGGHQPTNQFVISEHIEGFIGDIGMAKMFARMDPPKYNKVENVVNGCGKCHQFK
jgi:hypothetical protein